MAAATAQPQINLVLYSPGRNRCPCPIVRLCLSKKGRLTAYFNKQAVLILPEERFDIYVDQSAGYIGLHFHKLGRCSTPQTGRPHHSLGTAMEKAGAIPTGAYVVESAMLPPVQFLISCRDKEEC